MLFSITDSFTLKISRYPNYISITNERFYHKKEKMYKQVEIKLNFKKTPI